MSDNTIADLKGNPIEIEIGGEKLTVKRLSVDAQFECMNIWAKPTDLVEKMIEFVSTCIGSAVSKDKFSSAAELLKVFNALWEQNEFDFLSEQVAKLNQRTAKTK